MPNSIISEGKTTNEAIENGLKKLKVSKNQVEIKVLESEDKRSFFSILAPRIVKVELTVKENNYANHNDEKTVVSSKPKEARTYSPEELEKAEKNADKFLSEFLKQIGEDAKYTISKNENGLEVDINGTSAGFLIGYRGETLYSLQNILVAAASKGLENRIRVILDIEGYKAKRVKTLEDLADRMAARVIKTRKSVTLEPMKAYERKIIHSRLQNSDKVTTTSIGEEPRRRLLCKQMSSAKARTNQGRLTLLLT